MIGCEILARMRFEGQHRRGQLAFACLAGQALQNGLMAVMNAIKIADGQCGRWKCPAAPGVGHAAINLHERKRRGIRGLHYWQRSGAL